MWAWPFLVCAVELLLPPLLTVGLLAWPIAGVTGVVLHWVERVTRVVCWFFGPAASLADLLVR
eukprot:4462704-Alexandrium_andersonii.AAC.1